MTSEMLPQTSDMTQVLSGPEGDFFRRALEQMLHQVMEAEVAAQIGASRHERSDERTTWRNGYRARPFETRAPGAVPRSFAARTSCAAPPRGVRQSSGPP